VVTFIFISVLLKVIFRPVVPQKTKTRKDIEVNKRMAFCPHLYSAAFAMPAVSAVAAHRVSRDSDMNFFDAEY